MANVRVARVNIRNTCTLCRPRKQFEDGYTYGHHMIGFHKLVAERHSHGPGKGYNTGWWIKRGSK